MDPKSDLYCATIGLDKNLHPDFGKTHSIPYYVVSGSQPLVPIVDVAYAAESDPGPFPIPPDAWVEGTPPGSKDGAPHVDGDRHVLVIDRDNWLLYEIYRAYRLEDGKKWKARAAAMFDLKTNRMLGPLGWTSCDQGGMPIFPGLVRGDEVFDQKEIRHALRFTVNKNRRAFVSPGCHVGDEKDPHLLPMGARVRMKANDDISGFPPAAQVVLKALKTYGMLLADSGGDWFITCGPDPRWDSASLDAIKKVRGKDLEVVKMGKVIQDW